MLSTSQQHQPKVSMYLYGIYLSLEGVATPCLWARCVDYNDTWELALLFPTHVLLAADAPASPRTRTALVVLLQAPGSAGTAKTKQKESGVGTDRFSSEDMLQLLEVPLGEILLYCIKQLGCLMTLECFGALGS